MDAKQLKQAVRSLHRYFIWADEMKKHFEIWCQKVVDDGIHDRFSAEMIRADLYMSFWYGELFVVVEGWRELELTDPAVDALLKSPNVKLLKLYRNGVFHFQMKYFDKRFQGFITGTDTVPWVRDLHEAFSSHFLARFAKENKGV